MQPDRHFPGAFAFFAVFCGLIGGHGLPDKRPPRFTAASTVTEGSESRDRTASVHEDATSRRASGCAASSTIPGTEAFNTSPGASSVPDSAASRFAEASGSPACASPVNAATSRINASGSLNKTDRSPPTFASSKRARAR